MIIGAEDLAFLDKVVAVTEAGQDLVEPLAPSSNSVKQHIGFETEDSLKELHHRIIEKASLGMQVIDIAFDLQCSENLVTRILKTPAAEAKLARLRGDRETAITDVNEEIRKAAPRAFEILSGIMGNPDAKDADRIKIGMDILDRAGHAPVKKVQNLSTHVTLEEIMQMKKAALELQRTRSSVEDTPSQEIT